MSAAQFPLVFSLSPAIKSQNRANTRRFACAFLTVLSWIASPPPAFSAAPTVDEVLAEWLRYDDVLALRATVKVDRLTCTTAGSAIEEIVRSFHLQRPFDDVLLMQPVVLRIVDSLKAPEDVYYLRLTVEIASDRRRARNEQDITGEDGSRSESTGINDGKNSLQYTPSDIEHGDVQTQSGKVIIDRASNSRKLIGIDDLLPTNIGKLARAASREKESQVQISSAAWGGRVSFDIPRVNVSGTADFDHQRRILRSRINFPTYAEERHFGGYVSSDGFNVPRAQILARATHGPDGRPVSGHLEMLTLDEIEINPELRDSDFALAVPARTLVQEFDAAREIARVMTARPVQDLSRAADDLQSLAPVVVAETPVSTQRSWGVILLALNLSMLAIVLPLWICVKWRHAKR